MLAAAFASIAGSFDAYYVHFISPESYSITFSIILVTGVIIGGLGTIWGAFWGTLAIVVLPELLKRVNEDITNLVFGVLLIAIMIFWQGRTQSFGTRTSGPGVRGQRRVRGRCRPRPGNRRDHHATLEHRERVEDLRWARRPQRCHLRRPPGADQGPHRPQRRRQDDLVQPGFRLVPARAHGRVVFSGVDLSGKAPHQICRLGVGRTFQHSLVFDDMTVLENVTVGRHSRTKAGVLSAALTLPRHRSEERETFKAARESLRRVALDHKG